jgi:hypothetical protein
LQDLRIACGQGHLQRRSRCSARQLEHGVDELGPGSGWQVAGFDTELRRDPVWVELQLRLGEQAAAVFKDGDVLGV